MEKKKTCQFWPRVHNTQAADNDDQGLKPTMKTCSLILMATEEKLHTDLSHNVLQLSNSAKIDL